MSNGESLGALMSELVDGLPEGKRMLAQRIAEISLADAEAKWRETVIQAREARDLADHRVRMLRGALERIAHLTSYLECYPAGTTPFGVAQREANEALKSI